MKMHPVTTCALAAMLALVAAAPAQNHKTDPPRQSSVADKGFVLQAAIGGATEVAVGQLAAEKATNEEVKTFAKAIVDDHTKANEELMTIAKGKNIDVPQEQPAKAKSAVERLSKLSGDAFDRAFVQMMVSDHVLNVGLFKREANNGKDPELKAFADKTLPTLDQHLKTSKELAKSGGSTTKAAK